MDSAFLENTHLTEGNSRILYQMNELLDISTRYFLKENFGTIISSNRPKIMLNSRDSIIELKRTCLSCEEDWKDEPNPYKTRGKTFLDCFPSI